MFSEISGLNIVIDPAVQGSVDVVLKDVPWDQALDLILRSNKLGYLVDGTIVRIAPLNVLADEEGQRRKLSDEQALAGELRVLTRTLSYARAEELQNLLTRSALSPRGTVQVDPRTNTLIITDLADRLNTATDLINTLDKAQPQVEIEARIVQTNQKLCARSWACSGGSAAESIPRSAIRPISRFRTAAASTDGSDPVQGPAGTPTAVNLRSHDATSGRRPGARVGERRLQPRRRASARSKSRATDAFCRRRASRLRTTSRPKSRKASRFRCRRREQHRDGDLQGRGAHVEGHAADHGGGHRDHEDPLENATPDFSRAAGPAAIPSINTQRAITTLLVKDGETTVIGGI